jgi:copper resistance protein D
MIDGVWLVLRAAGLMLSLEATGIALFTALFAGGPPPCRAAITRRGTRLALAAVALVLLQVLCEPAHLAGDWSGLNDPTQWQLLATDSAALALIVRFAALVLIALAFGARSPLSVTLAGLLLVVLSYLLTGHTLATPRRALLALLLAAHVTAVIFWFGALWPLRQLLAQASTVVAAGSVAAFSAVALWLVPLLALAGVLLACLLLPGAAALLRPYGLLLLCKVALFTLLFCLAALNRLRLTPALIKGNARAASHLAASVLAEYVLIGVVLAVTAVMSGYFSPAGD